MLFSRASYLFALVASVVAVPYEKRFEGARRMLSSSTRWEKRQINPVIELGDMTAQEIQDGMAGYNFSQHPEQPVLPLLDLPPVSDGLTLWHIALGRGTQNYTCDFTNATAVPTAAGATADLYDIDDASKCNTFLQQQSDLMLAMPYPNEIASRNRLIGHHYFTNATTPYMNLDSGLYSWGQGAFAKVNASDAPSTALKGRLANKHQRYGAVPYLKLVSINPAQAHFQEVYRVNTAGGQPPPTCAEYKSSPLFKKFNSSNAFQIQYSAEYWFYAPASLSTPPTPPSPPSPPSL